MASEVIDSLFILTLVALLILIVMLIVLTYRANHVVSNWSKVTDVIGDSLAQLVPAVLNVATIGKGIHQVLELIAAHKKQDKEKN